MEALLLASHVERLKMISEVNETPGTAESSLLLPNISQSNEEEGTEEEPEDTVGSDDDDGALKYLSVDNIFGGLCTTLLLVIFVKAYHVFYTKRHLDIERMASVHRSAQENKDIAPVQVRLLVLAIGIGMLTSFSMYFKRRSLRREEMEAGNARRQMLIMGGFGGFVFLLIAFSFFQGKSRMGSPKPSKFKRPSRKFGLWLSQFSGVMGAGNSSNTFTGNNAVLLALVLALITRKLHKYVKKQGKLQFKSLTKQPIKDLVNHTDAATHRDEKANLKNEVNVPGQFRSENLIADLSGASVIYPEFDYFSGEPHQTFQQGQHEDVKKSANRHKPNSYKSFIDEIELPEESGYFESRGLKSYKEV